MCAKKCQNRARFDKVIAKNQTMQLFCPHHHHHHCITYKASLHNIYLTDVHFDNKSRLLIS